MDVSDQTNADGTFRFRGFCRRYEVETQACGQTITSDMHVEKGAANRFSIRPPRLVAQRSS